MGGFKIRTSQVANHRARALRKTPTEAEKVLWKSLRAMKAKGFHFRRQVPLGAYIADFACHSARLIIELDGGQHGWNAEAERDAMRTAWLENQGYRVIRFWNNEVLANIEGVLQVIGSILAQQAADSHPTPNPSPSRGGEPTDASDAGGKD